MRPAIVLGLFALAALPLVAQDPAASYACNRKSGTLVIRYSPDFREQKPAWPATVRFMSLLILDREQTTVENTKSMAFTCRLARDRFDITFQPGVPNVNLLGRCGDAVTGIVTVKRNGNVVVDEKEFEAMNCHEREQFLSKITFRDGSPEPSLAYSKYPEP